MCVFVCDWWPTFFVHYICAWLGHDAARLLIHWFLSRHNSFSRREVFSLGKRAGAYATTIDQSEYEGTIGARWSLSRVGFSPSLSAPTATKRVGLWSSLFACHICVAYDFNRTSNGNRSFDSHIHDPVCFVLSCKSILSLSGKSYGAVLCRFSLTCSLLSCFLEPAQVSQYREDSFQHRRSFSFDSCNWVPLDIIGFRTSVSLFSLSSLS